MAGIKHKLVPEHSKLSERDKKKLFEDLEIEFEHLPKISIKDPGIAHLDVKQGDIVKIKRQSLTAGQTIFYRGVS